MAATTPRSENGINRSGGRRGVAAKSVTPSPAARPQGAVKKKMIRRLPIPPLPGLYDDAVSIMVIPDSDDVSPREFVVYRKLACHYSTTFKDIFGGETWPKCYKLEKTYPRIFELWHQWLNSQRFHYRWKDWVGPEQQDPYLPLVELYRLGEELGSVALMNKVVTEIRKLFVDLGQQVFPLAQVVCHIYTITNRNAPLRGVVRDMYAFHGDINTLKFDKRNPRPSEFDGEVMERLLARTKNAGLQEPHPITYHLNETEIDDDDVVIVEQPESSTAGTPTSQTSPIFAAQN